MPSFRVTMTVGALRPGVPADRVLPSAADAAAELTTVEASSVNVVRGEARLTVTRRSGGRWYTVKRAAGS